MYSVDHFKLNISFRFSNHKHPTDSLRDILIPNISQGAPYTVWHVPDTSGHTFPTD